MTTDAAKSCFLVRIEIAWPPEMTAEQRRQLAEAEAARGRELIAQGLLLGIWRITGRSANVGVWCAPDHDALHAALDSLPLRSYMEIGIEPLSTHPLGGFGIEHQE